LPIQNRVKVVCLPKSHNPRVLTKIVCVSSVSGNETSATVPDTVERSQRTDGPVRPEVRERGGRRLERQQDRGELQAVGQQQAQDVDEQELYGLANHRFERAQPSAFAAQDMIVILIIIIVMATKIVNVCRLSSSSEIM